MKRKVIATFIITAILLTIFILIPDKIRKTHQFPDTLIVNNYTNYVRADTVVGVILSTIYGIDTVRVDIKEFTSKRYDSGLELRAFIEKVESEDNLYHLYLDKNHKFTEFELNKTLSHEMAHLKQYNDGLLYRLSNTSFVYCNETIDMIKSPYFERKFEYDAIREGDSVLRKLPELLYE